MIYFTNECNSIHRIHVKTKKNSYIQFRIKIIVDQKVLISNASNEYLTIKKHHDYLVQFVEHNQTMKTVRI